MLYLFALDESVNSFLNERKLLEETSSILNFRNNRLILIKKQKQKWYYCSLFKDMKLGAEFCFIKIQLLSSDPWFLLHTTYPTSKSINSYLCVLGEMKLQTFWGILTDFSLKFRKREIWDYCQHLELEISEVLFIMDITHMS